MAAENERDSFPMQRAPLQLVAWIGRQDLDGAARDPATGPIVDFLRAHPSTKALLLSDWPKDVASVYRDRLHRAVGNEIEIRLPSSATPPITLASSRLRMQRSAGSSRTQA